MYSGCNYHYKSCLHVYSLAPLSFNLILYLYHSSDVVTICNLFKQFMKARPTLLETYFILRFLHLYCIQPWDSWLCVHYSKNFINSRVEFHRKSIFNFSQFNINVHGHTHFTLYKFSWVILMKIMKIGPPENSSLYVHTCIRRHISSTLLSFLLLIRLHHTITMLLSKTVIKIN